MEKIENLNKSIIIKYIKSLVKSLHTKKAHQSQTRSTNQQFIFILYEIFQRTIGLIPTSVMKIRAP